MSLLAGKIGLVFGVANQRSIAWAIAQAWHAAGATLAFTYQGERLKANVQELAAAFGPDTLILPCDVTKDADIAAVFSQTAHKFGRLDLLLHSVAFAPREALEGRFINTTRDAFRIAHDVSAYSLVALARAAAPLMTGGGSIVAMTYYGARKVVPHYNVMGVAKAALESSARYLAYDLGPQKIRVNCISAGPVNTLAARAIAGFRRSSNTTRTMPPCNATSSPTNSAPPASSSPATAPPPSPARSSTWTAATKSWGCENGETKIANDKFSIFNSQFSTHPAHDKILPAPVGRRCCAALESRAERQLRPARKAKKFVPHPNSQFTIHHCQSTASCPRKRPAPFAFPV